LSENERKIPIKLRQAEALLNRIPKYHQKCSGIQSEIARRKAGYRGELNLDYHLSFLPSSNKYTIIKDIRMEEQKVFQIDTLLLSPNFSLIIDAKNFAGTLHIDPYTNQLIQKKGQNEDGFSNPILQTIRQQKLFKDWLQKVKFDAFPVEYLVAFHEGTSIFKTDLMDKRLFNRIIYAENILRKLEQFERNHQTVKMDEKKIRKLKKLILHHNKPAISHILEQYDISMLELITGVQCPTCQTFGMKRVSGSWKCGNCHTTSKNAHVKAIEEFLLLNHSITNQQCRYFLHLSSSDTAYRLLEKLHLPYFGENKCRNYFFNLDN